LLLPLVSALFLSTAVEFLQLTDFPRMSSVFDVACNVTGAAIGIAAARAYTDSLLRVAVRTENRLPQAPSPCLMLLGLWLAYQVFPLFPSISFYVIRTKVRILFSQPSFSLSEAAVAAVEWLFVAAILRMSFPATSSRRLSAALLLLLPSRFLLLGRSMSLSEFTGAVAGCIVWWLWIERATHAAVVLAGLMVVALIHIELSPYRFSATPRAFSWIPFAGFIETGPDWGAVVFLRKSFWYGGAIWSLRQAGAGYFKPALGISLLLAVLEWVQRYLPGRTPEITDPVLAIVLALFLYLFQQYSESVSTAVRKRKLLDPSPAG